MRGDMKEKKSKVKTKSEQEHRHRNGALQPRAPPQGAQPQPEGRATPEAGREPNQGKKRKRLEEKRR